ncbi:MAG: hypothetical protein ACYCZK_06120, partial [Microbacteriaceae bacterium]
MSDTGVVERFDVAGAEASAAGPIPSGPIPSGAVAAGAEGLLCVMESFSHRLALRRHGGEG